jgi:hypothetical protein
LLGNSTGYVFRFMPMPLGRPFLRARDDPTLHDASPQPFAYQAQDDGIGNAVGHHLSQPLMVDMVEASANVGLEEMSDLLRDDGPSQRP